MIDKRLKCVLVQPEFYGTEKSAIKSLQDNGFEVVPIIRRIGFKNPFLLLKHRLGFNMKRYEDKYYKKLSAEIESLCFKEKPDVLFITQGLQLLPDAVDRLRKHCITILDLSDRISLFPQLTDRVSHYDIVFSYSKEEIDKLKKKGVNAFYSYMGYDDSVYYPIEIKKDIDICFVGTMYQERRILLEKIAKDFSCCKISFYGKYASPFQIRDYLRWIRVSAIHRAFKNKNLNRVEVNKLYNRSKICININRQNMSKEWTPRIVEIMGAKGFQVIEKNALIEDDFKGCVCTYESYENLKATIAYYLAHDDDRFAFADRGYRYASENYSLRVRQRIRYDKCKELIHSIQSIQERSFDNRE